MIQYLRSRGSSLYGWLKLPSPAKLAFARDQLLGIRSDPGPLRAATETVAWLCRAQDNSQSMDGGVARDFSLRYGWASSYPETTGYIIPTLLDAARALAQPALVERAGRMLNWLVSIQLDSGAFQGGKITETPVVPVTFNTGQILIGLAAGTAEFGIEYRSAAMRAASWLCEVQDNDGCWRKFESPFALTGDKVYDTHVAWGLFEAAKVSGDSAVAQSASKNIDWAISRQNANGWFRDCCLSDPIRPLTHTIGYALRGIVEAYEYTNNKDYLDAAVRAARGAASAVQANGFIAGRLDENWRSAAPWSCLTGSAQLACCWFKLFRITGDRDLLDAGRKANQFVRRTIAIHGAPDTRGAIAGSFPVSGKYGPYQYLNWAAKFSIDANLLELSLADSRT